MYTPLHAIVKQLTTEKKSGSLRLRHDSDEQAIISFEQGRIVGFKHGELSGAEAGKKIALWIVFQSEFVDNADSDLDTHKAYHTERYLSLLERTARMTQKLMQGVPLNDGSVLVFIADALKGEKKFNMDELSVALALDGKTATHRVVSDAAVPDLQALLYINGFLRDGLCRKLTASDPLDDGQRALLINTLTETLAELVGPAAETIIEDAFQQLESEPQRIYRSELAQLMEAISHYMEEEDRPAFNSWALTYLEEI